MNDIEKGELASSAIQCFSGADGSLARFPKLLRRIIEERAWERRFHYGRLIEIKNLRELITRKPVDGWGQDPKKVEALLKDDPKVLVMWSNALKGEPGRHCKTDNNVIPLNTPQGNSKSYTLTRLKKDHGDLYQKVCDGAMSANAAAIQAGFRKKLTPFEQVMMKVQRWIDSNL